MEEYTDAYGMAACFAYNKCHIGNGTWDSARLQWDSPHAVGVVAAALPSPAVTTEPGHQH